MPGLTLRDLQPLLDHPRFRIERRVLLWSIFAQLRGGELGGPLPVAARRPDAHA